MRKFFAIFKSIFILFLEIILYLWKIISPPFLGQRCRFNPTCSEHLVLSIKQHGIIRGGYLGIKQFLRCHPLSKS